MENQLQTTNTQVANFYQYKSLDEFRVACQNFQNRLNQFPAPESIDATPDGKASTILISHIEMTLDEYFFGLWETENFKWSVISNEVVGSLDLVVIHPVTGHRLKRTGAASIIIMVDSAPDNVKNDRVAKNKWALNVENKKSNALDLGFPKLKAECLKNAAQSFGKLFGRDLNRKKADNFQPLISPVLLDELVTLFELKKETLTADELKNAERIINNKESNSYKKLQSLLQSK